MKKRILSLLAVLFLLAQCSACADDGAGKRVLFPIDAAPEYLDPQIASSTAECNLVANCFEGLVGYDETGEIVPAAAERFDVSADGLTYTFHLRDDLQWLLTNSAAAFLGEEAAAAFDADLTAEDFVYGLQRALAPETNSPAAAQLLCIENAAAVHAGKRPLSALGVEAQDARTLVIRLHRTDGNFLATLTEAACMPCDADFFAATGGRYGLSNEYLIYNGPFFISNWNSEKAITVRKNEIYHDADSIKPAAVYFSINNEIETRAEKVESGMYEVSPVTAAQAAQLSQKKDLTVRAFENATESLLMNCADALLQSAALRKAVAITLDRSVLTAAKQAAPAEGLLPAACQCGGRSFRKDVGAAQLLSGDDAQAKALFETALSDLDVREVDLTALCVAEDEFSVRTMMQKWQAAFGVRFSVSVEIVDAATLQERVLAGDYQLAFLPLVFDDVAAIRSLQRFASDSANNPCGLRSARFDALLQKAAAGATEKACRTALQSAEQTLINAAAVVPICTAQTYLAMAKGVAGAVTTPTGTVVWFNQVIVK